MGAPSSHYVTYAQDGRGTWCEFDDERVTEMHLDDILGDEKVQGQIYLAFYKAQQAGDATPRTP